MTRDERTTALYLLRLALQYVAKANEAGAYAGCVLSGDTVLRRLNEGIDILHGTGHEPTMAVEELVY